MEEEFPEILETISARLPPLRWSIYFGWRLATRWGTDECSIKSAAMAFFGLLSIFPLILAAVSIMASTLADDKIALANFQEFVHQFFPGQTGEDVSHVMSAAVDKIANATDVATVSIIAFVSLIWSGRAYFATLTSVLESVWPRSKPRYFWHYQLVMWSTFAGAGLLWILSTFFTVVVSILGRILDYLPHEFLPNIPLLDIASRFSSWLLTVFMFWLIYHFLPNVEGKRRNRIIWGAALLAALLWELSKVAFAKFLGNLNRYQPTYGSVAGVVLTLVWFYISSNIMLFGAECAAAYEETCDEFAARREAYSKQKEEEEETEPTDE